MTGTRNKKDSKTQSKCTQSSPLAGVVPARDGRMTIAMEETHRTEEERSPSGHEGDRGRLTSFGKD